MKWKMIVNWGTDDEERFMFASMKELKAFLAGTVFCEMHSCPVPCTVRIKRVGIMRGAAKAVHHSRVGSDGVEKDNVG